MRDSVIKRQIIDLAVANQKDAPEIQREVSYVYRTKVIPVLDEICDGLVSPDETIAIDSLELDVGRMELNELREQLPGRIKAALEEALRKRVFDRSVPSPRIVEEQTVNEMPMKKLEVLIHFLHFGVYPWQYTGPKAGLAELLREVMTQPSETAKDALRTALQEQRVRQRVARLLSEEGLQSFIQWIAPPHQSEVLRAALSDLPTIISEEPSIRVEIAKLSTIVREAVCTVIADPHLATEHLIASVMSRLANLLAVQDAAIAHSAQWYEAIVRDVVVDFVHCHGATSLKFDWATALKLQIREPQRSDDDPINRQRDISPQKEEHEEPSFPSDELAQRETGLRIELSDEQASPVSQKEMPVLDDRASALPKEASEEAVASAPEEFAEDALVDLEHPTNTQEVVAEKPEIPLPPQDIENGSDDATERESVAHQQQDGLQLRETPEQPSAPIDKDPSAREEITSDDDSPSSSEETPNIEKETHRLTSEKNEAAYKDSLQEPTSSLAEQSQQDLKSQKKDTKSHQSQEPERQGIARPIAPKLPGNSFQFQPVQPEEVYIDNAGLALLWRYFPTLFPGMGWTENDEFVSEEQRFRAIHFLQHLVTGEERHEEHELTFNKLLCGLDPFDPVPTDMIISDAEKEEAMNLLAVVIEHWTVLSTTSVSGLQKTFLQKDGVLKKDMQGWKLYVERSTIDILLDRLPWSYSIIKLPWLNGIINVEW